jgi:hypothetical protein
MDPDSILNAPNWQPMNGAVSSFGLDDLLKAALAG